MKAFFSYYGSKFRGAKHYPSPRYDVVVEPFAGSAGYSCQIAYRRQVFLIEKNPVIVGIWKYLQSASRNEIMSLPDLNENESVDDLSVCQEAKWLIGYWVNKGCAVPAKTASKWMKDDRYADQFWGKHKRQMIANQLHCIKHWTIIEGDYTSAPNIEATWFIDPPYINKGYSYTHNKINYDELGQWCKSRQGQVIVCEQKGADWLPFVEFKSFKSNHKTATSEEVIFIQDKKCPSQIQLFK